MHNIHSELREYFLRNIGQTVDSAELHAITGGIADLPQLIVYLRDGEGYPILTHEDRESLLPGQYLLESGRPSPEFGPEVSPSLRSFLMGKEDLHCEMCGAEAGDTDEYDPACRVRLHVGQRASSHELGSSPSVRPRVLCTLCKNGVSDENHDNGAMGELLERLQRATGTEQLDALAWLVGRFSGRARLYLEALEKA